MLANEKILFPLTHDLRSLIAADRMLMLFQQGALGELTNHASDCHNGSQQPKLAANGKYLTGGLPL